MADNDEELYSDEDYQKDLEAGENFFAEEPETSEEEREAYQQWQDQAKKDMPTPEEIGRVINDPDKMYGLADKATGGLSSAIHIMRTRDNPPLGRHELTRDDLLDMWEKAKRLPEPDRTKAIQQITRLSKEFESAAPMLVNILLESQFCANVS